MFTLAEKHEWSVAYVPHLRREFREESEGSRDRGNACFNLRGDRASSRSAVQVSAYCYKEGLSLSHSQFARVAKGVDLRSTGGNSAWVRAPQFTEVIKGEGCTCVLP